SSTSRSVAWRSAGNSSPAAKSAVPGPAPRSRRLATSVSAERRRSSAKTRRLAAYVAGKRTEREAVRCTSLVTAGEEGSPALYRLESCATAWDSRRRSTWSFSACTASIRYGGRRIVFARPQSLYLTEQPYGRVAESVTCLPLIASPSAAET